MRGGQTVDIIGDQIRQAVAIVAEFTHGDYLLVEIGGVSITTPGMGHTGAASHVSDSDRERYGQPPSHAGVPDFGRLQATR